MTFLSNEKAKEIKKKLVELEWTQETLARELKVSPTMVSLFMNGKKKSTRLRKKISDLFEIDLLKLI